MREWCVCVAFDGKWNDIILDFCSLVSARRRMPHRNFLSQSTRSRYIIILIFVGVWSHRAYVYSILLKCLLNFHETGRQFAVVVNFFSHSLASTALRYANSLVLIINTVINFASAHFHAFSFFFFSFLIAFIARDLACHATPQHTHTHCMNS